MRPARPAARLGVLQWDGADRSLRPLCALSVLSVVCCQYCAAGALSDIMQICNRTFSEAQVALIMKHALAGLAYLHSEEGGKRIHRDIKGQICFFISLSLTVAPGTCRTTGYCAIGPMMRAWCEIV